MSEMGRIVALRVLVDDHAASPPAGGNRVAPATGGCAVVTAGRVVCAAAFCSIPFSESLQVWAWSENLELGSEMQGSLNLVPHITELTHFKK